MMRRLRLALAALWLVAVLLCAAVRADDDAALVLTLAARTGGLLRVAWALAPAHADDTVTGFNVSLDGTLVAQVAASKREYELAGLVNNTQYAVSVTCESVADNGTTAFLFPNTLVVSTLNVTSSAAPPTPELVEAGGGFLRVRVALPRDTGGVPIATISVVVESQKDYTTTSLSHVASEPEFTVYGLDARTPYRVRAYVVNAAELPSGQSDGLAASTSAVQLPGACPPPTVLSVTGGSFELQLNPPIDDGGARIKGYVVYMAVSGSSVFEEVANTVATQQPNAIEIRRLPRPSNEPLRPLTRYDVKAVAVNMVGVCMLYASVWNVSGEVVSVVTDVASLPGAPPSPYFLSATGGQVTIQLLMPGNMRGAILTGFSLMVDGGVSGSLTTSEERSYSIAYLRTNSSYSVQVAVVTNVGASEWSAPIVVRTGRPSRPSPPQNVSATNITPSQALIQWQIPVDSGGVDITEYRLMLFTASGIQTTSTQGTSLSYQLSGLLAATTYTVKIVVINEILLESSVAKANGATFQTLFATAPGIPFGISAVSRSGGAIEVAWHAPEESGGAGYDGIIYNVSMVRVAPCYSNPSTTSVCGTCDLVRVPSGDEQYAYSRDCEQPSTASCPDGSASCCITTSNNSLGNGHLCSRVGGQDHYRLVPGGATVSAFQRLNHSTTYFFAIQAINKAGTSRPSSIVGLRTSSQTPPSYPSEIRRIDGTGGSVKLTWAPPQDTGGTTIVGYRVYRDYELLTPQPVFPPYVDCGSDIKASTQYLYGIAAVNASRREGSVGSLLVVTPPVTPPQQIQSLSLEARAASWLNLTVIRGCDLGGSRAMSYQFLVTQDGAPVTSAFFACCNVLLSGLLAGREYQVSVRVANEATTLEWFNRTFATTLGIPATTTMALERANSYSLALSPDTASTLDREIVAYEIEVSKDGNRIQGYSFPCKTSTASPGLRVCPSTLRVDGLSPNTIYQVSSRALGPNGTSEWNNQSFETIDEPQGVVEFGSQSYVGRSGGAFNVTVRRASGTAGSLNVALNVSQPETVVISCDCFLGEGCSCRLSLTSSKAVSKPGTVSLLDGQESQTIQVSVWEDDPNVNQPMSVVLHLIGASNLVGSQSQAEVVIGQSQRSGFPAFPRSQVDVLENSSYAKVNIARLNGSSGVITFDIETFDISSNSSLHYIPLSRSVQMADRQSQATVWVRLIDNRYYDGTRVFGVRLRSRATNSPDTSVQQLTVSTRRVTIIDDEDPSMVLPPTPSNLSTVRVTGGEIELVWLGSNPSNASANGYLVRVSTPSNGTDVVSMYNTSSSPSFILSWLEPMTLYRFQVAAWNLYGVSESSRTALVLTTLPSLSSPPLNFRSTGVGSSYLKLAWEKPRDLGGVPLLGFVLSMQDDGNYRLVAETHQEVTSYTVEGLSATTAYTFFVAARTTAFNVSSSSRTANLTVSTSEATIPTKPPPPTLMRQPTGGTLTFLIKEPQDLGGTLITNYSLYMRKVIVDSSGTYPSSNNLANPSEESFRVVCSDATPWANGSTARSCTVYKLLRETSYEVYVVLNTMVGTSEPSDRVIFRTSSTIGLPSPPENFQASNVTAGNIMLEWDLPLDLGGVSDVLGYTVFQRLDPYFPDSYFVLYDGQDSTERRIAVKGLTRNTTYAFAVIAHNTASYCVNLAAHQKTNFRLVKTLLNSTLSPPQSLRMLRATGGAVTIGWDAPDDLAGVPLQGYVVELISGGTISSSVTLTPDMLMGNTTSFTHYGLTEQTVYRYAVTAVNQDGPGERSTIVPFSSASVTPPSTVLDLRIVEVSGGRVVMTWSPPLDSGGRPILYYQVTRGDQPNNVRTVTSTSFTDKSGLIAKTKYEYYIRAFNGFVLGETSFVLNTTTGPPTVSDPPILTEALSYGGRIEITWASADDTGGVPVLKYNVTLFNSSVSAMLESYQGLTMNYTFPLLSANTPYVLELSTVNEVGQGLAIRYNVPTGNVDLPSAPPPPNASEILGGSMVLTASPPSYNGGEDVILLLWNDTFVVGTLGPGQNSSLVSGLVAHTQYRFRVSASNSYGQTIGEDLFVSTGPISTPSAVSDVQLVEATYDRLSISWAPVKDTGGDLFLQYEITYFGCDATGVALPTSTATVVNTSMTRIVLTSLNSTTSYNITVRPLTSSGIYGNSSEAVIFATEQPLMGRVIVQFADVVIREGNPSVEIPLTRVNGSFGEAAYTYQVFDETATAGANFRVDGSTGAMASGVKSGVITIGLVDDKIYYPNVTFVVEVQDVPSISVTRTRVTILDNGDAGSISFASPQFSVLENVNVTSIPITRNGGSSPMAVIQPYIHAKNTALVTRFTLVESAITFGEGSTIQNLTVLIQDDADFQYWPDTVVIKFNIVEGGVWAGEIVSTNLTAVDDGDVSPPKEVTGLKLVGATGGSLPLQWTPPVDRGAVSVDLWFLVQLFRNGESVLNTTAASASEVIYGLPAQTAYEVVVLSGNTAGAGKASNRLLVTTTKATAPTAPLNVSLVAASSSTLLLLWSPPVDAGGSEIIGYTTYRVQTNGSISPFPSVTCSLSTMCLIKGLLALSPYGVQVRAITAPFSATGILSAHTVFNTSNPDVPDPPPLANVTWVSAGAMTIKMFTPVNIGGSEVEQYRLFMRGPSDLDFVMKYQGAANSYTVFRLDRRTSYEIKYQVINSVGASDFGPVLPYPTLERSLVSAPVDVTMISATGGAITLQWNEPLDVGGRGVVGYTVMLQSDSMNSSVVGYDGRQNPDRRGVVYGLTANTTYSMYVVAYSEVSNCFSPTEWAASVPILASTMLPTLPTPAPQLLVVRVTGGIIELMWKPPIDEGGVPITGYTVSLVSPTGTGTATITLFSAGGNGLSSFIHNDLIESTMYTYVVKANSSVGDSPTNSPLVVNTSIATAPSAPLNVRQLQYVTGGAIQIGWDRPIDTGGQPLDGYWIYRDGAAIAQILDASARSYIDRDSLRAATFYTYTLKAIPRITMGSELSSPISAKTAAASKPQPPLLLNSSTGASFLLINWTADPDAGGLSESYFEAKLMQGSVTIGSYAGKYTSFRFIRLAAATTYSFLLVSNNLIGGSDPCSMSVTTLPATTPDAPPAAVAIAIFGGNITVEVTAPVDTGGVDISEMRVYEDKLGYVGNVPFAASALKAQFTAFRLVKTTDYKFTVSAVNRVGEGLASPPLTVRTGPINPPGAVSSAPNATGATGRTLSVLWAAPIDSGGDVSLTYEVRFVDGGVVKFANSTTRSVTGTSLEYNTNYSVAVRVVNSAGTSAWSPSLWLKTLPDAAGEFNFDTTNVSVLENAGQVMLNVLRTNGLSGAVTIDYSVVSSGASAATVGSDFALANRSLKTNGTLAFASQQLSAAITILILDDSLYESPDEQFNVTLTSAKVNSTGVVLPPKIGGVNVSTVTIKDDGDAGTISFSKANYAVLENATTFDVPIVREGGKSTKIVLNFTFTDGTATGDRDYRRPVPSTLTMDDGQIAAVLRVSIINDKLYEFPDEFFTISVSSVSGVRFQQSVTTITILDDGDLSAPAQPPAPVVLNSTGGGVRLAMQLPAHNGSATSVLGSYLLRVVNSSTGDALPNVTVPVSNIATVGGLVARMQYTLSVAVNNTVGWSTFSPSIVFSTTAPTLPGPVTDVRRNSSTGGSVVLAWLPPEDSGGVPITKYRIYQLSPQNVPEPVSEILAPVLRETVSGLAAKTKYTFFIQAGNGVLFPELAYGWGERGQPFNVTTPEASLPGPTLISKEAFANATGGSVTISWTPPLDTGGTPILSYDVFARNASTSFSIAAQVTEPASRFTVIDGLYASSWYEIFLVAVNNVRNASIPGVVTCAIGSNTLTTTMDLSKNVTSGAVIRVGNTTLVIGNMTLATKGTIPLAVAHVGKSISKQSAAVIGVATKFANLSTSAPTIPRVPRQATLLNATGGAIAFRFDPPGDTGGASITSFTVLVDGEVPDRDSVVTRYTAVSKLKKALTMRVTNLSPLSSINVTAIAVTPISLCDFDENEVYSEPSIFQTTNISRPEPPQIVQQYVTGGGMKLSLVDPFDKGGAEITRFLLYMTTNPSTVDWVLAANVSRKPGDVKRSSAVVARLKPLTKYHFRMSANNGAFESLNSTVTPFSTSGISPPGPCEEPRLVAATGGMLTVEWDDPLDNGGAAIIDFTITIQPVGATGSTGKLIVRSWQPRNYTFYGLTDETEYSVFVRARNEKGSGADGPAAVFSTTKGTPPSGNIAVKVVGSTGGAAILEFNEPLDLGGTPREDMVYRVYVDNILVANLTYDDLAKSNVLSPRSGGRRLAASAPVGVVVGGLDPLSLYNIQIQPVNGYATGNVSGGAPAATTSATLPSAPRALEVGDIGGGSVFLTWDLPLDTGGLPLQDYVVYMGATADGAFAEICRDTTTTCRVTGLSAATPYWFYVVSTNGHGASSATSTVDATTLSVSKPSVPGNVTVVSVSESTLAIAWTAPVDAGGSAITGYSVTVKNDATGVVATTVSSATTSATVTGLASATRYSVTVTAANQQSTSDPSIPRLVSTATVAKTPAGPFASCVSSTSVSLLWYPYPSGTQYRLFRNGNEIYTGTATRYVDSAVSSSVPYEYKLEVMISAAWAGALSTSLQLTTLDDTSGEPTCSANEGFVSEVDYKPSISRNWLLSPTNPFSTLTLQFTMFELECDHDNVRIERADDETLLWQGGCARVGTFVIHSTTAVRIRFTTDATVERRGFELLYETDRVSVADATAPRIAPPQTSSAGAVCASRGVRLNDGTCKCSVGFTGEACSNHIVCCIDPLRCFHDVCSREASRVITVSDEFGDDALGTGAMMDTSEMGSASKAVKSLAKGLSLARDGDTIFVYPGVYKGAVNRALELASRRDITIESLKGFTWTTIDCENFGRAISISQQSNVVIDGFTIKNGLAPSSGDGGAISVADSSLALRNVLVTDSTAGGNGGAVVASRSNVAATGTRLEKSSARRGGAVLLVDSVLTLQQSNVTQCKAEHGGAVTLAGTSSMVGVNGSFLSTNVATGDGGGVLVERGVVSIQSLRMSANEAAQGGAFAAWDNSNVVFDDCVVNGNNASTDGGGFALVGSVVVLGNSLNVYENVAAARGGGLFANGPQISVASSSSATTLTFTRNQADDGAGIAVVSSGLTLSGLVIERGSASQTGGGISAADSSVKLKNVAISLNAASTAGGGLHVVNSELIVDDGVVVDSNQATTDGGGMYMRDSSARGGLAVVRKNTAQQRGGGLFGVGSVSLTTLSIQACTADEGAGMFLDTATATVTRVEVIDCLATTSGGGAFLTDSALTVVSSAIRRCSAVSGGGVRARGVSSINGDLQVTNGVASDKGGALYATDKLTLSHVVVQASNASHGGGIFADAAIVLASNVTLEACVASVEGGGWAAQTSALTLKDVRLLGHHSATTGGGLALLESHVVHDNVNISGNAAAGSGGGLAMVNSTFTTASTVPSASVTSVISKNSAQKDGGNVYFEGTGTIASVRIAGGDAVLSGGGVAMNEAVAVVRDCVVLENHAGQRGGGLSVHDGSTCEITDSIVSDNVALAKGGGVSVTHSVIRHGGLSLLRNAAPNGGGLSFDGVVTATPVTTDRVSIARANRAVSPANVTGDGSAVYLVPTSDVEIAGFQIHEGVARRGAAFADAAKLRLHDCSFEQNSAAEGAALFATANSDVTVAHANFSKNAASLSGGAVALTGDPLTGRATARLSDCTLTLNRAVKMGGAVALSDADVTLTNVRFTANSAASDDEGGGGAVAAISSAAFKATGCSFVNNTVLSTETKGATFYLLTATAARLTNTSIVSDSDATVVPREGGAVYITDKASTLSMVGCEITNGRSYSGGAVYVAYASLSLVGTTVRNAQAFEFGGGVYSDSGTVAMENCTLRDNRAFYDGGAIYVRGETSLAVTASRIQRNTVQDGGGGIFVAPGGGATVVVTNSTLKENANRGLGSAIFVGRKNTLTLTTSALVDNGGAATEGGALYAVDAQVEVAATVFRNNSANRGAAIELSRNASLTMTACDLVDNRATVWGGALYMSVRSSATLDNATIQGNTATTGGAVYLLGSSALTMRGSTVASNRALSFGGALTLVGRASADIAASTFQSNAAYTGGVVSITQNASLALAAASLVKNSARDFGGAIYIDTLTATSDRAIRLQGLDARDNAARAGPDIYWVFHPWFALACDSCRALSAATPGALKISTSPIGITAGWWPTRVTSGVSLGATKPNWIAPGSSSPAATTASPGPTSVAPSPAPSQRRLDASSSMDASTVWAIVADPDQTNPVVGTLWPTLVVRDYYGAIADQDNRTMCLARKVASEQRKFDFYPSNAVSVASGYVTFDDAQVLADSGPEPFELFINCTLADDVQREWTVTIKVDNCDPGFENTDGRCLRCKKGMYSLDGVKCHACPLGATCEGVDESKSPVGVSLPVRAEGFFLHDSRESYLGSNCLDLSSWDAKDPCKHVEGAANMNMTYLLQRCSGDDTFKDFWPPKRIFACLSELEYYACETRDACMEEDAATVRLAKSVHELSRSEQCELGYGSVTCATCQNGFYRVSNGTCNPCSDPRDPNVAKMTRLMAMVPLGFAFIVVLLVWYYFSSATESELTMQARAARKFQVYDPHAPPQSLLLAATFFIQQRVADMMARARRSFVVSRRRRHLFQIAPRAVGIPPFRAEKFKIMLGFFQIFGGFKKLYEIPWPDEMSRLMDIFSIADFSLVDTTGIECFIHKDYFSNYRLSIIGVLTLLLLTTLLLSWGVVRYRVKLSGLPRHCVSCGLPVFKMLRRQPKTLVRRSTMVSILRIQQKEHGLRMRRRSFAARAKDSVANKLESVLSRMRKWWGTTRLGRLVNRFIVFTRLPASSSRHYPTCPTAQRIESEVLQMVVRSNLRLWRSRVRLRLNYQSFQNKCIKLFFWILLLFYPELSQRVVGIFYCDEIGTKHYMSRDKSRLCYEGEWLYYLPLTMLLIAVWVIGVPLLFWIIIFFKRRAGINDKLLLLDAPSHVQLKQRLLREMREDLVNRGIYVEPEKMKTFEKDLLADFLYGKRLSEPSMVAQVGFIYHSYRNEFWWFEVWDLGRKLFLNCVIGLLAKTGANRIIAGLIVFLIYLSVMLFFQPFKEQSDSTLAGITQIQLFVTLFCGLMLKMGALHMQDSVVMLLMYTAFISNVLTLTFAVFSIVYEKIDATRKARRRAREDHKRAIQAHVRKLWLKAYGWALTEVYLLDTSIRPMPFRVILELARRDREEKKLQDLDLQLARSLHADGGELIKGDENVSASHVELELPRPGSFDSLPRS